jgi:sarcosine oxidase delta subunit
VWSEAPASALGAVIACPHCGERVKLNPFTINADWRPIAEGWKAPANDE